MTQHYPLKKWDKQKQLNVQQYGKEAKLIFNKDVTRPTDIILLNETAQSFILIHIQCLKTQTND